MSTYLYHDGHTKMILDEPFFQRLTLGTGLIEWDFSENDEMKRLIHVRCSFRTTQKSKKSDFFKKSDF